MGEGFTDVVEVALAVLLLELLIEHPAVNGINAAAIITMAATNSRLNRINPP